MKSAGDARLRRQNVLAYFMYGTWDTVQYGTVQISTLFKYLAKVYLVNLLIDIFEG
jgi:hypothetical protein